MNERILNQIRKEFEHIGEKNMSGKTALQIVDKIVDEFTVPREVEQAIKFVNYCDRDMGFMGSPEYYKQKEIIDNYNSQIEEKSKNFIIN